MVVRDYELDRFGVIKNAVYQNYLEHIRHMFLGSLGLKFTDLYVQGFSPVITRAELDYCGSLKNGDEFVVNLKLASLTKVEFISLQEIRSLPGEILIINARTTGNMLNSSKRPFLPAAFKCLRTVLSS